MKFLEVLRHELKSEIRSDLISKRLYSVDASIYEIEPQAVLIPRSKSELVKAIELSSQYAVPIIPRGAATGITGGCLGHGLVIDTSVHLNRVVELNFVDHFAVVQPGIVADRLNEQLKPHGLYFAPEISTSNRATIGGMVANNAAGANSLHVGKIQDHVIEVELILWNGEVVRFGALSHEEWKEKLKLHSTEGRIYRHLEHIRKEFHADIIRDFPKTARRASGYNLDVLLQNEINVAALICGSEGTFGVISELKLKLSPLPKPKTVVVIGYDDFQHALTSSFAWLDLVPDAVELIDSNIIEAGKKSPSLDVAWLEGQSPQALILWELDSADLLLKRAKNEPHVLFAKVIDEPKKVWSLRKAGLGLLLSQRSYSRAIAFIEDVAVPPDQVAPFIAKLQQIVQQKVGIYGHIGAGCLHIRPYIDLRKAEELKRMETIFEEVAQLLEQCGGVFSGEHGDGLVRTWTNKRMFGPRLYEAFLQLKEAFDPYHHMNPGKIVAKKPQGLLENLRLSPATPIKEYATYMDFTREGGFSLAVDLCNGNGQCRKKEGVMCPSFQATHDEKDSTRGRAQALRGLIHGQLPMDSDLHQVMDLCLQCKGCKTECPSQVDMAKMKSEYLHKKTPSIRDRFFGHLATFLQMGSLLPKFANLSARVVAKLLGIERTLPKLSQKRFSDLFKPVVDTTKPQIVLFVDSYTEFLTPEIGLSAVKVLEALGFAVVAPRWTCCGRPLISKGFLPEAKEKLHKALDMLYPYAQKGIPIVGLEPSCLSALTDEIRDFHLDAAKVQLVVKAVQPLEHFLLGYKEQLKAILEPVTGSVLVHGHCHHKALFGMKREMELLRETVAPQAQEIPSGCCGMAGAFGYEKEHLAISKKIGELVLFPAIRANPEAIIIANGNSCRSQVEDVLETKPLHFIQFLASRLGLKGRHTIA
ncbi:MAG: FAD-binding protein [Verrucomicrobia bacterium]|nr:FAD-binding protein [Verrucomicrobiota bacterium]MBS0636824.1 FAD-binding protein [Verrucomicrobiota bacterium]